MIDLAGRKIVMVDINGVKVPFYCSTGLGGKDNVPAGKWYPFFGLDPDGWFNKGYEYDILDYYGSPELAKVAKSLDSKYGDLRNSSEGMVVAESRKDNPEQFDAVRKAINEDVHRIPGAGHVNAFGIRRDLDYAEARRGHLKAFYDRIERIKQAIKKK